MKIIYYDGSILTGSTIEFYDDEIIIDGVYIANPLEILRIEEK